MEFKSDIVKYQELKLMDTSHFGRSFGFEGSGSGGEQAGYVSRLDEQSRAEPIQAAFRSNPRDDGPDVAASVRPNTRQRAGRQGSFQAGTIDAGAIGFDGEPIQSGSDTAAIEWAQQTSNKSMIEPVPI